MKSVTKPIFLIFLLSLAAIAQETPQVAKAAKESDKVVKSTAENIEADKSTIPQSILANIGTDNTKTVPLTLQKAIQIALENNNEIEVSQSDVKIAENQLASIRGSYDPVFTITPTYSRSSSTGSSSSNDFRFSSDLTKNLVRGGGSYNTFFDTSQSGRNSQNNTSFNQTSSLGSSSSSTYSSSLGFRYTQPLFRNRKIDNTRRLIQIQKKRIEQSDSDFRLRTITVISQVQQAYWDLVFALRDQQNQLANLNLSKENLRIVEARIAAGSAAPLQRAEVSTELANRETSVILATETVSQSQNRLKQLLLKDVSADDWNAQYVPTDSPKFNETPLRLEDAMKDAISNRSELQRLKIEGEINEIEVTYAKNQLKPRIDFNSTFSLNGLSLGKVNTASSTFPLIANDTFSNQNIASSYLYSLICPTPTTLPNSRCDIPPITVPGSPNFFNGGYARSIANFFRKDAPNYSIGVTIQFPWKNKTAKAELAIAEIQKSQINARTRTQEQSVVAEVRNAVQSVETTRQRVLASRRARENAEIQLKGEQKLYEAGRSTTFLLFQRENALTNAKNSEIRAETDFNKALAELQRATSTTFEANNIQPLTPSVIK
jgi:outer membrane protein